MCLTSTAEISGARRGTLIGRLTLRLPRLPEALAGLRVLHVSDPHARRTRRRYEKLLAELAQLDEPVDLLALTGDYMCRVGDEPIAYDLLKRIVVAVRARLGAVGVFGNHDSPAMRQRVDHLPVHWLTPDQPWIGGEHASDPRATDLCAIGVECGYCNYSSDLLASLLGQPLDGRSRFRIMLSHLPHHLPGAADAGIDLVLSGHTHGGQCRLPGGVLVHGGYGDWPLRLSTGVLRLRNTLAVINRGLGETKMDGLRLFCPPHALLMTLEPNPDPPTPAEAIERVVKW